MAKLVLLNVRTFAGGADLTTRSNQVELTPELQEQDATPFRPAGAVDDGWPELLGGLASCGISATGQWEAGDPGTVDPESWNALVNRSLHPWTVCPESAAVGGLAWFTSALRSSYKIGDTVGEVAPWEAAANSSGPLLRGTVAHPPGTPRTVSGDGDGLNLGAVTASQRLYAVLHVLSIAGTSTPTLTVDVEQDVDSDFLTATTVASFAPATALGGQFISAAGPIDGPWYRVTWDITGTDPSFLFIAALAIG